MLMAIDRAKSSGKVMKVDDSGVFVVCFEGSE